MLTYADVYGIHEHAAGLGGVAGPCELPVFVSFSLYLTRLLLRLIHAFADILIHAATDVLKYTLYAGMVQDWEQSLGGGSSLRLLQETLAALCTYAYMHIYMCAYVHIFTCIYVYMQGQACGCCSSS